VTGRSVVMLAAFLAASAGCRSATPVELRVDMPVVALFPASTFAEIVVTDFRNAAPVADIDPGLELQSYLAAELRHVFKGTVSLHPLPAEAEVPPSFWRQAAAGHDRAIFLTGAVSLSTQVRKALQDKHVPVDGPFKLAGRGLIERRRWTLAIDLVVISGETGEALYRKKFRDDRDYIDLEKPADFAFSELSARFRGRLFPLLFGGSTVETRTLLNR
jgi:hypothetical protein